MRAPAGSLRAARRELVNGSIQPRGAGAAGLSLLPSASLLPIVPPCTMGDRSALGTTIQNTLHAGWPGTCDSCIHTPPYVDKHVSAMHSTKAPAMDGSGRICTWGYIPETIRREYSMYRILAMAALVSLFPRTVLGLGNVLNYPDREWQNLSSPNYFISGLGATGTGLDVPVLADDHNQVKFQVQVNYRIAGWAETMSGFYFGYTQLSFWRLYDAGSPFDGNSYRPELFLYYEPPRLLGPGKHAPALKLSLAHESNGLQRGAGRSWDRIIATAEFGQVGTSAFSGELSTWYVLDATDPLSFRENIGDGRVQLNWSPSDSLSAVRIALSAAARFVYGKPYVANVEVSLFVDPFNRLQSAFKWLPAFMAQYYYGTGESLTDYTRRTSVLRFGIAFL
ncbi:MAG: hypothetical protein GF331_13615 [Chitinivibrionales bacterium]|nr:hypothetical protein [Chitinivibrionales bacterium]